MQVVHMYCYGTVSRASRWATRAARATCATQQKRLPDVAMLQRPTPTHLADALRGLGDMPAANDAYNAAEQWARRVGRVLDIDWVAGEQALQAYHAGHFDVADRLLAGIDPATDFNETQMRIAAGRIALARGAVAAALTAAEQISAVAAATGNSDGYFAGVA